MLDESCSMAGETIENLNKAVNRFASDAIKREPVFSSAVEMYAIAFNHIPRIVLDWTPLGSFQNGSIKLEANGGTTIASALDLAFEELKKKKSEKSGNSVNGYVSYVVLISDGLSGRVDLQAGKINELTQQGGFKFWMLGVTGYDKPTAEKLTAAGPERLYTLDDGEKFDFTPFFNDLIGDITGTGPGSGQRDDVKMNKTKNRIG